MLQFPRSRMRDARAIDASISKLNKPDDDDDGHSIAKQNPRGRHTRQRNTATESSPPRRLSITLFLRATQTANEGHADPSFWTLNVFPLRCGKVTIFGHWIWAETRERKLEEQFIRHELFLFFSIEIWRTKTEPYGRRDCIEYTQT